MAKRGLLDGNEVLALSDGELTVVSIRQRNVRELEIELERRSTVGRWSTVVDGLEPDPTADAGSDEVPFAALDWPAARRLLLAGRTGCVVLDRESGHEVHRFTLDFVDRASIDVLGLALSEDQRSAVVTSTRKVVVLGSAGHVVFRYETDGLIRACDLRGSSLDVRELDVNDPALPEVRVSVPIE